MKKSISLFGLVFALCFLFCTGFFDDIYALKKTFAAEITASGTCGDDLIWTLDDTGTLIISGTGEMFDYGYGASPFSQNSAQIIIIVLERGVSGVGKCAFCDCQNITKAELPDDVTKVGEASFSGCTGLVSVRLGAGVQTVAPNAFYGCENLSDLFYNGSQEDWGMIEIDDGNFDLLNASRHFEREPMPDTASPITNMGVVFIIFCILVSLVAVGFIVVIVAAKKRKKK